MQYIGKCMLFIPVDDIFNIKIHNYLYINIKTFIINQFPLVYRVKKNPNKL